MLQAQRSECHQGRVVILGWSELEWLLWVIPSECQGSAFAERHMCRLLHVCARKSYSRNSLWSLSHSETTSDSSADLVRWYQVFAEWSDDMEDLKVEMIWGETVALSKNSVFLEKWHVYMTVPEISPWCSFLQHDRNFLTLCVNLEIRALQTQGRSGMWLNWFTGHFFM